MIDELERMWKEAAVSNTRRWAGIRLEGLKKSTKNFGHDNGSPGRDLFSEIPRSTIVNHGPTDFQSIKR
jgi:hypothetical protein